MRWLSIVKIVFKLDGLNQVIHIDEVTSKLYLCSIVRVYRFTLPVSAQELLD